LLFGGGQIVQAEPAPDKLVVNHETKECALIFGGLSFRCGGSTLGGVLLSAAIFITTKRRLK